MKNTDKVTKKQLLNMIDDLQKNPHDKIRILGQAGITTIGTGLGMAAAGTLAAATGATSIFGVTTAASWLGVTAVAATPVGWIIGAGLAGGAIAYGVSRMVHNGGLSEGRKAELLQKFKEEAKTIDAKERAKSISEKDRSDFIISMRELIDKNAISPDKAATLIGQVEQGLMPLSQAFELIEAILQEK